MGRNARAALGGGAAMAAVIAALGGHAFWDELRAGFAGGDAAIGAAAQSDDDAVGASAVGSRTERPEDRAGEGDAAVAGVPAQAPGPVTSEQADAGRGDAPGDAAGVARPDVDVATLGAPSNAADADGAMAGPSPASTTRIEGAPVAPSAIATPDDAAGGDDGDPSASSGGGAAAATVDDGALGDEGAGPSRIAVGDEAGPLDVAVTSDGGRSVAGADVAPTGRPDDGSTEVPVRLGSNESTDAARAGDETSDIGPEDSASSGPTFDAVRVEPDGLGIVSGRGVPGADVILRLDGEEIATGVAGAGGDFALFVELPTTGAPRVLSIETRDADGIAIPGPESLIVAPTGHAPAEVAAAVETPRDARTASGSDVGTGSDGATSARTEADGTEARGGAGMASETTATVPTAGAPATDDPDGGTERAAASQVVAALDTSAGEGASPDDAASRLSDAGPNLARASDLDLGDATSPPPVAPAPDAPAAPASATITTATAPPAPPTAPRLFRNGPQGLSVEPASPAVVETLGLDAIAYDAAGEVSLAGRARSDTRLQVYLDNRPVRQIETGQGGAWASPLPDVAEGVYTLRIDAIDRDGAVVGRLETPFERTAPELAAAARASGTTALTVQPGFTLWAISEGYYGDGVQYVQIFEANRDLIRDPDLIYPGQVFTLPQTE